jgi:DNA polymerase III epsilon subunit-like protein
MLIKGDCAVAKCVRCGISGPFVKVNEEGICPLCQCRPEKSPRSPAAEKVRLALTLDAEQVLHRYLTTSHSTYPKGYGVVEYYTAEFDCILASLPRVSVERWKTEVEALSAACYFCKGLEGLSLAECGNFVALDTETSGLTARAEIVEVSAVRFEHFRPVSVFATLCKPYGKIAPDAAAVHGITDGDVKDAPRFAEILPGLEAFIDTFPLVAHNAPFDLKMLAAEGMDNYGRRVYDTLPIARKILRTPDGEKLPHYRLADCCRACAILFSGAHRSTADALAAGMLFLELVKRHFGVTDLLRL